MPPYRLFAGYLVTVIRVLADSCSGLLRYYCYPVDAFFLRCCCVHICAVYVYVYVNRVLYLRELRRQFGM